VSNMGQVYVFGHLQRHPDWKVNPWIGWEPIMRDHFGTPKPTLVQMVRANPKAVAEHVAWNFRLLPAGLQLLLFNAAAGGINPDYVGDALNSRAAAVLGVITIVLVIVGLVLIWRDRRRWWRGWLRPC